MSKGGRYGALVEPEHHEVEQLVMQNARGQAVVQVIWTAKVTSARAPDEEPVPESCFTSRGGSLVGLERWALLKGEGAP